jgi:hypothetical protein
MISELQFQCSFCESYIFAKDHVMLHTTTNNLILIYFQNASADQKLNQYTFPVYQHRNVITHIKDDCDNIERHSGISYAAE